MKVHEGRHLLPDAAQSRSGARGRPSTLLLKGRRGSVQSKSGQDERASTLRQTYGRALGPYPLYVQPVNIEVIGSPSPGAAPSITRPSTSV